MSYDISIVQNAQGYFDTSLQTFDLFGAGDRGKNRERDRTSGEERREIICSKATLLALVFSHIDIHDKGSDSQAHYFTLFHSHWFPTQDMCMHTRAERVCQSVF